LLTGFVQDGMVAGCKVNGAFSVNLPLGGELDDTQCLNMIGNVLFIGTENPNMKLELKVSGKGVLITGARRLLQSSLGAILEIKGKLITPCALASHVFKGHMQAPINDWLASFFSSAFRSRAGSILAWMPFEWSAHYSPHCIAQLVTHILCILGEAAKKAQSQASDPAEALKHFKVMVVDLHSLVAELLNSRSQTTLVPDSRVSSASARCGSAWTCSS